VSARLARRVSPPAVAARAACACACVCAPQQPALTPARTPPGSHTPTQCTGKNTFFGKTATMLQSADGLGHLQKILMSIVSGGCVCARVMRVCS
jgi:hypothetical protein